MYENPDISGAYHGLCRVTTGGKALPDRFTAGQGLASLMTANSTMLD
jgi:hypothetical protein